MLREHHQVSLSHKLRMKLQYCNNNNLSIITNTNAITGTVKKKQMKNITLTKWTSQ